MGIGKPQEEVIPIEISVIVTQKNDKPAIELRRCSTDPRIIKQVLSCAYHGQPVTLLPTFTSPMQSLASMVEKGIVHKDPEDGQYYFLI